MESDTAARNRKLKKVIKIILKILYNMLVLMCVLLTMIIVLQKITDNNRTIGGYRIFRVITGSMLPEYDVGEVVISKETNPKDIKVGDDIVYRGTYGEYNGKIIMHQVTQIDKDEKGKLNFHAKGLHSGSVEDPQIKEEQIYGVVKIKSNILTILYQLATSIYSSFIIITILVLNVFISFKAPRRTRVQRLEEHIEYEEDISEEVEEQAFEDDSEVENYEEIDEEVEADIEEDVDEDNN